MVTELRIPRRKLGRGILNICSEFFQVQEAMSKGRGRLRTFPSPIDQEKTRAWNFPKCQSLYKPIQRQNLKFFQVQELRRTLGRGIFPGPKAHIKREKSEFFQVPRFIQIWECQIQYIDIFFHIPSYFRHIFSYFLHIIPSYFLHIP